MSSDAGRAATLQRALEAAVAGDHDTLATLFTDDVKAWTSGLATSSAAELLAEFDRRDDAFSDMELDVMPLDVGGDFACVEWQLTMTHTGELTLRDGVTVPPTGQRVTLHGVTVAEFIGRRIGALRQYWDELSLYEQLGLLDDDDEPLEEPATP
jgi:predicted ester cyclase